MTGNHVEVKNSGAGNCMYYAYGISLMYYLRAQRDMDTAREIFKDMLKLDKEQRRQLFKLLLPGKLHPEKTKNFNSSEIHTIENILGPATRNLAAHAVVQVHRETPRASSIFFAANYGMTYFLKRNLHENDALNRLFPENEFTNTNFTESEIYRVPGLPDAMVEFSQRYFNQFKNKFNEICRAKRLNPQPEFPPEALGRIRKRQEKILDELIAQMTEQFFKEEDEKNLKAYEAHLAQNKCWGSEEALFALHERLTNEHHVRNEENGEVEIVWDFKIPLGIFKDGQPICENTTGIMLNNSRNTHWTSYIPQQFVSQNFSEEQTFNLFETIDIGMIVVNEFIFTLGIAAVALAFTALNASSGGFAGLLMAGIGGVAAAVSGRHLFFNPAQESTDEDRFGLRAFTPMLR